MDALGGGLFLMSEVPLYHPLFADVATSALQRALVLFRPNAGLQGYLAHKKTPTPLG